MKTLNNQSLPLVGMVELCEKDCRTLENTFGTYFNFVKAEITFGRNEDFIEDFENGNPDILLINTGWLAERSKSGRTLHHDFTACLIRLVGETTNLPGARTIDEIVGMLWEFTPPAQHKHSMAS